jgi:hypothetical protein
VYAPEVSYQQQVDDANRWLKDYDIELQIKSVTSLTHLSQFQVLDLSIPGNAQSCYMPGGVSAEQRDLYINHRGAAPSNEIVIYYVLATTPAYWGCASHPPNQPSACVVASAGDFTLPHEIGHILGLHHVNNNYRLMTGNSTGNIQAPPPDLVESELATIWRSPYVRIVPLS